MTQHVVAVVVEADGLAGDVPDVALDVDDVQPHRLGGQHAVGHAHASGVQAVTGLGLVERDRPELPQAGAVHDPDGVEDQVGAQDEEGVVLDRADPALGEVRVGGAGLHLLGGEGRLGAERAQRGGGDDAGAPAEHGGLEHVPSAAHRSPS
ncbi:hypothetical protein ACFQ0B_14290 [Nonomuraea thailandensis]